MDNTTSPPMPELEKLIQTIKSSSATTREQLDIINALIEYIKSH